MKIDQIPFGQADAEEEIDAFSHLRLSDSPSLTQILDCLAAQRPSADHALLCTLDDLDQCLYTSMHASDNERIFIDDPPESDESSTELTTRVRRLNHVVEQLQHSEHRIDWMAMHGTLFCNDQDIQTLVEVNQNPDSILDETIYILRIPVEENDLLIAAMPNGYFSADWDVFQNHALIRHLGSRYGYRLFGIGAAWLGFQRDAPPTDTRALVADLRLLYGSVGTDSSWNSLGEILSQRNTLFVGYTEDFGA